MTRISKNNESIIEALSDKKSLVQEYVEKNKLKCRKEEDLVKVFNYYNSINK